MRPRMLPTHESTELGADPSYSGGSGNALGALHQLKDYFAGQGYSSLRIIADRVSGANPGRGIDITIPLG